MLDGAGTPPVAQQEARQTATRVFFNTTWAEVAVRLPALLSLFAIAFVVGYFYAIDIAWFSLFSLSERIVLVLRSLPIAIGATLFMLMMIKRSFDDEIVGNFKPLELLSIEDSVGLNIEKLRANFHERPGLMTLKVGWLVIVIIATLYMFHTRHVGTGISFLSVVVSTIYFEFMITFRKPSMHIMYWGIKVAIMCLFVGYISGSSVLIGDLPLMITPSYNVAISIKPEVSQKIFNGKPVTGRLIFTGNNGVLVYAGKQIRLVRWDSIAAICGTTDNSAACGSP